MEFFCHHRDRPGALALRQEVVEQHRAYMDGFEAELIARTLLTPDRYADVEVHHRRFGRRR